MVRGRSKTSPRPSGKKAPPKTRKKPALVSEYDPPWKEMLREHFEAALAFFHPDVWADIDWKRSYEPLDKELHKIMRDAGVGRRLADLLVKVWLKDGTEQFVLAHVEVQGQKEEGFAERMFVYNYRVFDVYRRRTKKAPVVVSFAILTDDNPDWKPSRYRYGRWQTKMEFDFRIVKLREYNGRWAELEADPNPFALVVMAFLKARETSKDFQERLRWKHQLVRQLYGRGFKHREIVDLFRFIDWVMALPEELDDEFWNEHLRYETEKKMKYVTSVERMGIRKGRKEGREEGRKVGRREGRKEGKVSLFKELLLHRFSEVPVWVETKLSDAGQDELDRWGRRLLDARSLEDVFATT